ncbi:hypothetical protein L7F22_056190 [Adiantum nelumboides]|nr:hypothetical protein [Adiantum nelumboides]
MENSVYGVFTVSITGTASPGTMFGGTQSVVTSPFEYLLGEVLRPPSISQDTQSAETDKKRQHVYNTMFHVPWRCELLIVTGFFGCLDSFLSLLTIMPARVLVLLWRFTNKRQFRRLRADELSDLGSLLVLMAGVTLLQQADISYIYHMIRSQATIKLYVVYNVLEIFDKLCQSFGSDVFQVVLNSAENVATCSNTALLPEALRFAFDECIAIVSFDILLSITVSAAIRSHNNALLTLLISNNFAEIKSNVFKRLAKDNLHKLAYLDTVERFHIVAHLFFVFAQNFLAAHEPWLHAFAWNAGMVFLCEVLVDVIKHAFLAKFNEIKPTAYSEFLLALCKQTLSSQSRELHKTMSFVPFAPACVVIRVVIPLYAAYLPGTFLWRVVVILFFGILTSVLLVALKILVALGLLKHARCSLMDEYTQPLDDSQSLDLDDAEDIHLDRLHTILLQLLTQLRQDRAIVTSELANAMNPLRDAVQTYQIDFADVQVRKKLEEQVFLLGRHLAGIRTQLNKLSGLIIRLCNALDRTQM